MPGSPLLLSQCADQVKAYRDVLTIFVERDPASFANLSRVLEEKGGGIPKKLLQGSLDDRLPEVLELARNAAMFAFLDPFGPALDYDMMRRDLLGRRPWPPTEILLHFSVLSVARIGGVLRAVQRGQKEPSASERKTIERLDRFLGGNWWQARFASVQDSDDEQQATRVAMEVADAYRARATADTGFMSISMPVRPRPELLPQYVLVLFTRKPEGAWHFADVVGKAGLDWMTACYNETSAKEWAKIVRPDQSMLFGDDSVFGRQREFDEEEYLKSLEPAWVQEIEDNIRNLVNSADGVDLAAHIPEVYGRTLGTAGIPQIRKAVKSLHRQGVVTNDGLREFHRRPGGPGQPALSVSARATGIWLHVSPSSTRPPVFGVFPPHCLKKKATSALTQ